MEPLRLQLTSGRLRYAKCIQMLEGVHDGQFIHVAEDPFLDAQNAEALDAKRHQRNLVPA